MRPASHMPLAEMMTLGTRSALIIRDSSLVTLTCSPGNWMGSMPWPAAPGYPRQSSQGRILEDAGRLDGKRAVDVDREIAVSCDKAFF